MTTTPNAYEFQIALNAEGGAPSRIQLMPAGRFDGRRRGGWINDRPDQLIAAFNNQQSPAVIDYEQGPTRTLRTPFADEPQAQAAADAEARKIASEEGSISLEIAGRPPEHAITPPTVTSARSSPPIHCMPLAT